MRTRLAVLALALVAPLATPVLAETVQVSTAAATPKVGQLIRDAGGFRIGRVGSVRADQGVVTVIVDMRLFRIPISTLSATDKGLTTTLSRKELR